MQTYKAELSVPGNWLGMSGQDRLKWLVEALQYMAGQCADNLAAVDSVLNRNGNTSKVRVTIKVKK